MLDEEKVARNPAVSPQEQTDFRDEHDHVLKTLLTQEGFRLWRIRSQQFDSTPTVSDSPASRDELGRDAFAQAIVQRIRWMRHEETNSPLLIHLHGPWGSGKTSILNFMRDALKRENHPPFDQRPSVELEPAIEPRSFHIVQFNAWRYQHMEPPWWSLWSAIQSQLLTDLLGKPSQWWSALKLGFKNYWFRIFSVKSVTIFASVGAIAAGITLISLRAKGFSAILTEVKTLSGISSLVGGTFFALMTFLGIFFPKPEEAADRYVGSRADPLFRLQKHICSMIGCLPQPLAVMVDDLDRCDAGFVVRFLEGIQTLFTGAPVVFIIAADRKWIHRSFEKSYEDFGHVIPGKPLGFLFLEKTFQMSVGVPPMNVNTQLRYLRSLLHYEGSRQEAVEGVTEAQARSAIAALGTETDIISAVRQRNEQERTAFAREAVIRLAAPDVQLQVTRHRLERFAQLLERNPRSMKRFIMAYGMNQATDLLLEEFTNLDKLALWTILSMRWPELVVWFEEHPEYYLAADKDDNEETKMAESIKTLLDDPMVRRVLKGFAPDPRDPDKDILLVPEGLDADTLRHLSRRASTS